MSVHRKCIVIIITLVYIKPLWSDLTQVLDPRKFDNTHNEEDQTKFSKLQSSTETIITNANLTYFDNVANINADLYDLYSKTHPIKFDDIEDKIDQIDLDYEYDPKLSQYVEEDEIKPSYNIFPFIGDDHIIRPGSDRLPIFLQEPQNSFVVKNKPATLQCRAANTLQIYYRCNDERVKSASQFEFVNPHTGIRIVEAEHNVTRDEVEEYFGKDRFKCECHAWASHGQIKSQPAFIEVAYLKKIFSSAPHSSSVELYGQASMKCLPPQGAPAPKISWLKNGLSLTQDNNVIVSVDGQLLINQATLQDIGNYTCVAENVAGKRLSDPALLTVYVNGGWSSWSPWSDCKCPGKGSSGQKRIRTCSNPQPLNGGQACIGTSMQRTQECVICPYDNFKDMFVSDNSEFLRATSGRWSSWGEWSGCGEGCVRVRRRACLAGDGACVGRDTQRATCDERDCAPSTQDVTGYYPEGSSAVNWLYLLVGLISLIFLAIISFLSVNFMNKRINTSQAYKKSYSDFHPEILPISDIKKCSLRPDLTRHNEQSLVNSNLMKTRKSSERPLSERFHNSEHLYDVPQLSCSYMSPVDYIATGETADIVPQSRIQTQDVRRPEDSYRVSVYEFLNNDKGTRKSLDNGPYSPMRECFVEFSDPFPRLTTSVSQVVSSAGAWLRLESCGVALYIPEGALPKNTKENVSISVPKDDSQRPTLSKGITQLSPVIKCNPKSIRFKKPVIIQFPHCANLKNSNWELSLLGHRGSINDVYSNDWTELVTFGYHDNKNNIFLQVDTDLAFVMTEVLTDFVLAGHSTNGNDTKFLKTVVFASSTSNLISQNELHIRIYVFEDTKSNLYHCLDNENKLGGLLMGEPETLHFQDECSDLCLCLDEIGNGWRAKYGVIHQEIPFNNVWNSSFNLISRVFALEQTDSINSFKFKVIMYQKKSPSLYCSINIEARSEINIYNNYITEFSNKKTADRLNSMHLFNNPFDIITPKDKYNKIKQRSLPTHSKLGIIGNTENLMALWITAVDNKKLCNLLDPISNDKEKGDWRTLVEKLNISDIYYFTTKISPTEALLNLWECRNKNTSAIADLVKIFNIMNRSDAASIIEKYVNPNWL